MLVTFMACDLAPAPDIQDVGTGVAQSWYTEYLARLEAERIAKLKGKPKSNNLLAYYTCINFLKALIDRKIGILVLYPIFILSYNCQTYYNLETNINISFYFESRKFLARVK